MMSPTVWLTDSVTWVEVAALALLVVVIDLVSVAARAARRHFAMEGDEGSDVSPNTRDMVVGGKGRESCRRCIVVRYKG